MPNKDKKGKHESKNRDNKAETKLSRRDFLKLSIPVAGLCVFGLEPIFQTSSVEAASVVSPDAVAMLYQSSICLGCRRCEDACRRWNKLGPEYRPTDVTANSLTTLKYKEVMVKGTTKWLPSKWQCMHCINPSCVNVCPTEALQKTSDGPVSYDESKCIGCQYCVSACPFSIPRFDWEHNRVIKKCTFCTDRLAEGLEPACSSVCPVHALTFGDRQTVMAKAEEARLDGAYIYGKDEAGGTSWIYTSEVPFEERGVPVVNEEPFSKNSGRMLGSQLGTIAFGAVALGVFSMYLRRKRIDGGQK